MSSSFTMTFEEFSPVPGAVGCVVVEVFCDDDGFHIDVQNAWFFNETGSQEILVDVNTVRQAVRPAVVEEISRRKHSEDVEATYAELESWCA